ncbi:MAG: nuclear transport factor 2 family protein [Hyphomonadaceae bacterium]
MSELAALVRRYVERYNANDVDGMLDCCADDVVFETVTNPGGSFRLSGKDEMREVIEATTRAFRERRHEVVAILVDGERAAAETVFSGVAAAELGHQVRPGEHVSIRGATMFEFRDNKLSRICDYS